jgi:uncharacterized heparinase superfamily protein
LPAAARFHLHPLVRTSLVREGTAALLALPSGEVWTFEIEGATVAVEDSIFLAAVDGRRRCEQLVVAFDAVATPRLAWRFSRVGTVERHAAAAAAAPPDAPVLL